MAGVLLTIAGCSSTSSGPAAVPIYCAKSAYGCICKNTQFTLGGQETPATDCDTPPAGATCGMDLNASGESTFCDCATWVCFGKSKYDCACQYVDAQDAPPSGQTVQTSCLKNPVSTQSNPSWCCDDSSCACGTDSPTNVTICHGNARATDCSTPSAGDVNGTATSCKGVHWAAPPPPSSGGGGGGGGGGSHCGANGTSCVSSSDCCGFCELDSSSSEYHTCQ